MNNRETSKLIGHYVCAFLVMTLTATLVSWAGVTSLGIGMKTFLSGANLIGVTVQRTVGSGSIAFIATFTGILFGSYGTPSRSRRFVCIAQTVIGSILYQSLWYFYWQHERTSKHGNSTLLPSIIVGGLTAWLVITLVKRGRNGYPLSDRRS